MSAPSLTANPEPPQDLSELTRQVQDLQQRVLTLEQRLGEGTVRAAEAEVAGLAPAPVSEAALGLRVPSSALPALGRALLAMAGAYLLRALTEFGAMPPTVGVAIGLIYAVVWLLVAARLPVEQELATVLTSGTSMLIMGPLIWEAFRTSQGHAYLGRRRRTGGLRLASPWPSPGGSVRFSFPASCAYHRR